MTPLLFREGGGNICQQSTHEVRAPSVWSHGQVLVEHLQGADAERIRCERNVLREIPMKGNTWEKREAVIAIRLSSQFDFD